MPAAGGPAGGAASIGGPAGERAADALASLGFSGVALAVSPDGVAASVAMGLADRAAGIANTASTRFGLASVGKLFTAVALVRLCSRGAATLETRVADVLPAERRPRTLDPGVTLGQLLSHSSGMDDYFDEYGGVGYDALWLQTSPAAMRAPADLLPLFTDRPPLAAPGSAVRYCNAAFVLAGLVLEALAGQSYYEAIAGEVFAPAGMAASGYPALDDVEPGLALGYLPPAEPGGAWRTNLYAIPARGQPDGGAYSSAADLVRFLDAVRSGPLVDEAWLAELVRPRAYDPEERVSYGLGFWISGEGPRARCWAPGEDPGFAARVAWYPGTGWRLVVLSNVTSGAGAAFRALEGLLLEG